MADTGGTSPGELGGLVAGVLAVAASLGTAIKWVMGWRAGREETRAARNAKWESELDARERAMEERLSGHLESCENRCADLQAKFDKMSLAILLVLPELARISPFSAALRHARDLLKDTIPALATLPPDMADVVTAIDAATPDTH